MTPKFVQVGDPPTATQRPQTSEIHGIERTDEFAWLRADNWQEVMRDPQVLDGEIRAYLEAENSFQQSVMSQSTDLQDKLFEEMKGRIKQDDSSVPAKDGRYRYQIRFVAGGEQPRFVRIDEDDSEVEIVNGDSEAEGHSYFRLGGASHSVDHKWVAWSADNAGSEYFELKFRNVEDGQDQVHTVPNTSGGGTWSADSQSFVYTQLDEHHRPSKVMLHALGTDTNEDKLLFEEKDPGQFVGVGKSQSGDWIFIDVHDHESSEVFMMPAGKPEAKPRMIAPRQARIEYSVDEGEGILYILTNDGGATDFKIVTAPAANPGKDNWSDLVPHQDGRLILSHDVLKDHLVWLERQDGLPRIMIRQLSTGEEHAIAFNEEAYSLGLVSGYEYDTSTIRFVYSSMTTPSRTYDYDLVSRARTLMKEQEIPSGHDPQDYVTRRVQARSHDGALVPVSLLYRKDTVLDGSA
ncbi:MAG: S9 family peptidase, partial [Pseudomonadota bacterium]